MAEYIEREASCRDCLHYELCVELEANESPCSCMFFKPAADVVEVVRCKDCKHAEKIREEEKSIYKKDVVVCGRCFTIDDKRPGDWYCPEGEKMDRKGDGDDQGKAPLV